MKSESMQSRGQQFDSLGRPTFTFSADAIRLLELTSLPSAECCSEVHLPFPVCDFVIPIVDEETDEARESGKFRVWHEVSDCKIPIGELDDYRVESCRNLIVSKISKDGTVNVVSYNMTTGMVGTIHFDGKPNPLSRLQMRLNEFSDEEIRQARARVDIESGIEARKSVIASLPLREREAFFLSVFIECGADRKTVSDCTSFETLVSEMLPSRLGDIDPSFLTERSIKFTDGLPSGIVGMVLKAAALISARPEELVAQGLSTRGRYEKVSPLVPWSSVKRWFVGRTITLPTRSTEEGSVQHPGRRLRSRFMVRGFWRNQSFGSLHSLRKLIWIEPFWKGPRNAEEAILRQYEISNPSA